jgi:murein DD-endopeptidase MepM/ murein hydrolase activator NlpD
VLPLVVGALVVLAIGAPASAQSDEDAAQRAAREIAAARDRANQAAEDYFAAESELGQLEVEQERLGLELDQVTFEVADLKRAVESVAVSRFVGSGASGIPILTDLREPTEQMHGDVLVTVVAESGATTLDDYDAARDRLEAKTAEVEEHQRQIERKKQELLELQADAEAEVERLRAVEARRLENEAVQAALEAQQREEARQLAELERREAESARVAAANAGVGTAVGVTAGSSQFDTSGRSGASGGEAGGRTGGGGSGTTPRMTGDGFVDQIICPVAGVSAYGDTWGAPRSGGRRHMGVDMIAPTGTPLQAVVSGTVVRKTNQLGGITIALFGDNGNRYYYAHMSAYEGEPGRVEQGQVVGRVGESGNATGIPHLHFEVRPGGGVNVNPYPSVRAAGC